MKIDICKPLISAWWPRADKLHRKMKHGFTRPTFSFTRPNPVEGDEEEEQLYVAYIYKF